MTDELTEDEWRHLRVGTHFVQITKQNGELNITIRDHGKIVVDGKHKSTPRLIIEEGEFPTDIEIVPEGTVWDRYHGDNDS